MYPYGKLLTSNEREWEVVEARVLQCFVFVSVRITTNQYQIYMYVPEH